MEESAVSFGVISTLGEKDMVLTLDHYNNIVFSLKGEVTQTIHRKDLLKAVQNVLSTSQFSIYFIDDRQPIHVSTLDESMCFLLCRTLNDYIQSKPVSLEENFFSIVLEGCAEKKGKHCWTPRFLRIYGERLFIFRNSFEETNEQRPLNVIDIPFALIDYEEDCTIKLITHREYELRFADRDTATQWYQQLCQFTRQSSESKEQEADKTNEESSNSGEEKGKKEESESKSPKLRNSLKNSDSTQFFVSAEYLQAKLKEREERRRLMESSLAMTSSTESTDSGKRSNQRDPFDSMSSTNSGCTTPPVPPPPPPRREHQSTGTRIELRNY